MQVQQTNIPQKWFFSPTFCFVHDYTFVLFLRHCNFRLLWHHNLYSYSASFLLAMILKNPIFGTFEAKYLCKYLPIQWMVFVIQIISPQQIFEKMVIMSFAKWKQHVYVGSCCVFFSSNWAYFFVYLFVHCALNTEWSLDSMFNNLQVFLYYQIWLIHPIWVI